MAKWRDISVGDVVVHDGREMEVRVLKPGGSSVRAVLADPNVELSAKVAIRVKLSDEVSVPEGAEEPDRAGKLVEEVLGAVEAANITKEGIVCPKMNVTLIASHLRIMHGVELQGLPISSEDELLRIHQELHEAPFHEPEHPHTHEGDEGDEEA